MKSYAAPPKSGPTPQPGVVFVPLIGGGMSSCMEYPKEQAIVDKMRSDPNQQRPSLNCNPILVQVARSYALDMGMRGYFSHVNPEGFGPNYLVQKAGYLLPSYYDQSLTGNNIESIAAGYSDPNDAWTAWMNSPSHRTHLLGLNACFAAQIDYGIGFATVPGSPYTNYWVVITARKGP